jgi:hypothetical protein
MPLHVAFCFQRAARLQKVEQAPDMSRAHTHIYKESPAIASQPSALLTNVNANLGRPFSAPCHRRRRSKQCGSFHWEYRIYIKLRQKAKGSDRFLC